MTKNIYTVLLVMFGLYLTQGLDARSTYNISSRISDEYDIKTLNELLNKIQKALENNEVVIQSFEEKIKEDLDHLSLPQIIADLEKKLEEISEEANASFVVLIKCLTEAQPALRDLEFVATKGLQYCLSESNQTKDEITKKFTEVREKAAKVTSNITGGIMECLNHPFEEINYCLKGMVNPSIEEVNSMLAEIDATVEKSQKLIEEADLHKCVAEVQKEIVDIENGILDNFQKCVIV